MKIADSPKFEMLLGKKSVTAALDVTDFITSG
jgi:hypothetical protein